MTRRVEPFPRLFICLSWFVLCAQLSETEFLEQSETATCDLYTQCIGEPCADEQHIDRSDCGYDGQAAQDCVDGLDAMTCTDLFNGSLPSACNVVYDCPRCDDDPFFEDMDRVSEGLFGDSDVLCGIVKTDVSDEDTVAGNPDWGPWMGGGDHTEFHGVYAVTVTFDQEDLDRIDGYFPCWPGVNAWTECANFQNALQPGPYVVIGDVLQGGVPLRDPGQYYQYGFVFDADGDPSNNLEAMPPFMGDFFQDTDFWNVLDHNPTLGWSFSVSEFNEGVPVPVDSSARAIISGNTITALVPQGTLTSDPLGYRVTVHCHQGDLGENLPTTADTEAPIDEPLRQVDKGAGATGGDGGPGGNGGTAGGAGGGAGGPTGSDGDDGCSCRVSPRAMESNALLALAVLAILSIRQARRKRRAS